MTGTHTTLTDNRAANPSLTAGLTLENLSFEPRYTAAFDALGEIKIKRMNAEFDDVWFGVEDEDEGLPVLIRGRQALGSLVESNLYPRRIDIVWRYEAEDESAMPNSEENELMGAVENALADRLEEELQTVLAFVFTGKNHKVWYWYTTDVAEAGERINEALAEFDELPIEIYSHEDAEWGKYRETLELYGIEIE